MPKPSWKTPNVTVISRGKPEEKVLLACKGGNTAGPPDVHNCKLGSADCSIHAGT